MDGAYVVVGAGLAGAKAVEALREEGFEGPLILLGAEAERPYERPPLSKGYLQGKAARETVFVHPPEWYAQHDVDLRTDTTVTEIDPTGRTVRLGRAGLLGYGKLLLATGAEPRQLPVPGAEHGVLLRTLADSDRLRSSFRRGARIAVIGAGWIGLEAAAAAREAGAEVTVLEAAELPLLRVLGREAAQVFADLHRAHGVDLRFNVGVTELTERGVRLGDGELVEADTILVGVGVAPRTALAEAAGLVVRNGIRTDRHLRTSDPHIYAAGDVANADHPLLGRPIRVEHWANALHQPRTAARSMLGQQASYDRVPYFFTDQFDLGMEYTGYVDPGGYDQVVFRGDVPGREFIAFWLAGGRVLAGMNVNVWDVTDPIRALVRSGRTVDPARLTDPDVSLEEL